jgi:type 1 glutamine amidotransferase
VKCALIIAGDLWHPADTVRRGLAPLSGDGFEFEFLADDAARLPGILPAFAMVLLAKANMISAADQRPWLTPEIEASLLNFVRHGGGLAVMHAGTSRYESSVAMNEMMGGAFERHPDLCAVALEPVSNHPLVKDVAPFTVHDEHYFMKTTGAAVDVFLHSRSRYGVQPAGWTRVLDGGGRVFVLTPGHHLEVWLHPAFQKLLLSGMKWVAKVI